MGMAVHPVIFSTKSSVENDNNQMSLIIFIHGRLESDSPDESIPNPKDLYRDFCVGLADKASQDILLPQYHEHYRDWRKEPRDFGVGPVSNLVSKAIRDHIMEKSNNIDNQNDNLQQSRPKMTITLISFSMGAAILLKLLKSDPFLSSSTMIEIDKLILIEPVWRCWVPFAVSEASSSMTKMSGDATTLVSDIPALALAGTNDDEVWHDSGGGKNGVARSLRPFLSNLSAIEVEGGNHFGFCSGIDSLAMKNLSPERTPSNIRKEIIHHIVSFCGWE